MPTQGCSATPAERYLRVRSLDARLLFPMEAAHRIGTSGDPGGDRLVRSVNHDAGKETVGVRLGRHASDLGGLVGEDVALEILDEAVVFAPFGGIGPDDEPTDADPLVGVDHVERHLARGGNRDL